MRATPTGTSLHTLGPMEPLTERVTPSGGKRPYMFLPTSVYIGHHQGTHLEGTRQLGVNQKMIK